MAMHHIHSKSWLTRWFLVLVLASAGVALAPAEASAQQTGDEEKARAYYEKGVEAFFSKKYSQAITYFQRAHTLDPDPVVLYNISLAHSKMGNPQEALDAALQAQKMGGLPRDTALKNEFRIRTYHRILKARAVATAINPPVAEGDGSEAGGGGGGATAAPVDEGLGALGWTGVTLASLGAVTLAGAGAMNFMIAGDLDEYDTAREAGEYERAAQLKTDIEDQQQIGQILLYSGAGLAAVGGGMLIYDLVGSSETPAGQARVFGAVEQGGASVQLRLDF